MRGFFCGVGENRTRVQTPDTKAFYMLRLILSFRPQPGDNQTVATAYLLIFCPTSKLPAGQHSVLFS